ncbi:hypothetical protein [Bacillus sp. USDA818B3_A]|uniref:hypothetical protein n=1 Tax=Bacillus sp. USDA818B3_A TaxID=2698834 RepID=UPI00136DE33C|nr:hypothetical protein [Bacillus sp. USDA818B3_A]
MAKKENETDLKMETDQNRSKVDDPRTNEQPAGEADVKKAESNEQLSSLDLLWSHAYGELDEWVKRADQRDAIFLKAANQFAESIERNKGNLRELAAQFNQEFSKWELAAREEFLMSTTSLQHFFPLKSYEDINKQIDQIQEKTLSLLSAPCQRVASTLSFDKYLEVIEQFISLRKRSRQQYINTVKQVGNLIYENQKAFVNLFARQIRILMFPLNKYLEKPEELTKI